MLRRDFVKIDVLQHTNTSVLYIDDDRGCGQCEGILWNVVVNIIEAEMSYRDSFWGEHSVEASVGFPERGRIDI